MAATVSSVVQWLRQPQSAAFAGIAFSVIFGGVIVLLQAEVPDSVSESFRWTENDGTGPAGIDIALSLIPFAGIAFLWFLAVIRVHLSSLDDRLFETVFLGSGLLLVATMFAGAAVLQGVLALTRAGVEVSEESRSLAWTVASAVLAGFGTRMAAIFVMATASAARRAGAFPRWLTVLSLAVAALLLLSPPLPTSLQLLLPAWVLLLSVLILGGRLRARHRSA